MPAWFVSTPVWAQQIYVEQEAQAKPAMNPDTLSGEARNFRPHTAQTLIVAPLGTRRARGPVRVPGRGGARCSQG